MEAIWYTFYSFTYHWLLLIHSRSIPILDYSVDIDADTGHSPTIVIRLIIHLYIHIRYDFTIDSTDWYWLLLNDSCSIRYWCSMYGVTHYVTFMYYCYSVFIVRDDDSYCPVDHSDVGIDWYIIILIHSMLLTTFDTLTDDTFVDCPGGDAIVIPHTTFLRWRYRCYIPGLTYVTLFHHTIPILIALFSVVIVIRLLIVIVDDDTLLIVVTSIQYRWTILPFHSTLQLMIPIWPLLFWWWLLVVDLFSYILCWNSSRYDSTFVTFICLHSLLHIYDSVEF